MVWTERTLCTAAVMLTFCMLCIQVPGMNLTVLQSAGFGGSGGIAFDDNNDNIAGIIGMKIRSGNEIDSIQVTYRLKDESTYEALMHGGTGGSMSFFTLADGEKLIRMEGMTNGVLVEMLTFYSNYNNTYGPYGLAGQKRFSVAGLEIVAIFGRAGNLLDAIGAYVIHCDSGFMENGTMCTAVLPTTSSITDGSNTVQNTKSAVLPTTSSITDGSNTVQNTKSAVLPTTSSITDGSNTVQNTKSAVLPTTSSITDGSNTVQNTKSDTTTAVVITFVVTTVIIIIVGVVFGSFATFLIMKKRTSIPEHPLPTDGASGGPFYEQVSPSNTTSKEEVECEPLYEQVSPSNTTSKEEVEMDQNVAYGHVQQRR